MTDPELRRLHEALDAVDRISDAEWLATLDERKRLELEFHDRDRERSPERRADAPPRDNQRFYSVDRTSRTYVNRWIEERVRGRVFLDYACGAGGQAQRAARSGAALSIGLDISRTSIENARADSAGLENVRFVQGDCENTMLPDKSVDVVLCSGMLHHLDLSYAFPELRRILKPGGVILGVEALAINPVIRLYRKLTPEMRTAWEKEHILSHADLHFARRFFEVRDVRYWHLFNIPAAFFSGTRLFKAAYAAGELVDRVAMRIPGLNRLAWIFTFELHRPSERA